MHTSPPTRPRSKTLMACFVSGSCGLEKSREEIRTLFVSTFVALTSLQNSVVVVLMASSG